MPNEGYIMVKKGKEKPSEGKNPMSVNQFFTRVDKGSSRPAFCLPRHFESFKEENDQMERALDEGHITPDRKLDFERKFKVHSERLEELKHNKANAKNIITENLDSWVKRRNALAKEISNSMPSATDVAKKRVNPFSNLKKEKGGLEAKKQEYIIISKAMQAAGHDVDSNISFLEKD